MAIEFDLLTANSLVTASYHRLAEPSDAPGARGVGGCYYTSRERQRGEGAVRLYRRREAIYGEVCLSFRKPCCLHVRIFGAESFMLLSNALRLGVVVYPAMLSGRG